MNNTTLKHFNHIFYLNKKMVINQIVKFRSPKDKERHLRKQLQLFIQKRQFVKTTRKLSKCAD